jgi:uncharacterized membrane protein
MNWLLLFIREVCLVVWLGGLVVIDFVETPIRFRTPEISKEQATAIGSRLFARFGWIQVLLGVILLLDSVSMATWAGDAKRADWAPLVLIATMFVVATIQSAYITPQMLARMGSINTLKPDPEGQRSRFRKLHKFYISADIFKLLVGFSLLLRLTRASS